MKTVLAVFGGLCAIILSAIVIAAIITQGINIPLAGGARFILGGGQLQIQTPEDTQTTNAEAFYLPEPAGASNSACHGSHVYSTSFGGENGLRKETGDTLSAGPFYILVPLKGQGIDIEGLSYGEGPLTITRPTKVYALLARYCSLWDAWNNTKVVWLLNQPK